MKEQHCERVTETIIDYFYHHESLEEGKIKIIPQLRIVGGSKTIGSKRDGKAEFGVEHIDYPDILLLAECKAEKIDHTKAELEAQNYKNDYIESCITGEMDIPNIATLAVSGTPDDFLATFLIPNRYNDKIEVIETKNLLRFEKIIEKINYNESQIELDEAEILVFSKRLHNFLRDSISASESEKPLIVAAIAIALKDEVFIDTFKSSEKADCSIGDQNDRKEARNLVKLMMNSLENSLRKMIGSGSSFRSIMNSFHFMLEKESFYAICEDESFIKHAIGNVGLMADHTNLYVIIEGLKLRLFNENLTKNDFDVFGKFYDEFIKYAGGDGKGLGIVLTPRHILDLMCDLGGLDINSDVYDPCTGTGGFLVTAMAKMIEMAGDDTEKIEQIKKEQIYGIELRTDMYALAAANMIFKGDGHPDILNGSCFNLREETRKRHPNLAPFNPPYNLKTEGMKELDFIIDTANALERDGKVVVIIPRSVGTKQSPANLLLKKNLLEYHTLETVIGLPNDLFEEKAGIPTMILIITAHRPHLKDHYTQLINFEDDGFENKLKAGRVDINYEERKSMLLDIINGKKVIPGISALQQLNYKAEWSIEHSVLEVDYEKITPISFLEDTIGEKQRQIAIDPFTPITPFKKPSISLDTQNWMEFKLGDIFKISSSSGPTIHSLVSDPSGIPLINASKTNKGVVKHVLVDQDTIDQNKWDLNEGPCITAPKNGSILHATYRERGQKFLTSNGDSLIISMLNDEEMTENIGSFLITVLRLIADAKYLRYGYNFTLTRAGSQLIKLPVMDTGTPDWDFMERYMDEF